MSALLEMRQQGRFHHGLFLENGRYHWKYTEGSKRCCEDYSHGALTMRFVTLLRESQDRLGPLTPEPIQLDSNDMRAFANTFLHMTDNGNVAKENDWGDDDNFDDDEASEDYDLPASVGSASPPPISASMIVAMRWFCGPGTDGSLL